MRQAVDQVDADGLEAAGSCRINDGAGFFQALDAVDGCLYLRVKVLYADRHAVETKAGQVFDVVCRDFARIDFD